MMNGPVLLGGFPVLLLLMLHVYLFLPQQSRKQEGAEGRVGGWWLGGWWLGGNCIINLYCDTGSALLLYRLGPILYLLYFDSKYIYVERANTTICFL